MHCNRGVCVALTVISIAWLGCATSFAQPTPFADTPRFAAVWVEQDLGMMVAFSSDGIFTMTSTTNPGADPVAGTWGVVRNRFVLRTAVARPSQIWSMQMSAREKAALLSGPHDLSFVFDLGRKGHDLAGTLRIWNAHFDNGAISEFHEWDEDGALAIPVSWQPVFRVYSMVPQVGGDVPAELLPLLMKLDPSANHPIEPVEDGGYQGGVRPKDSIPYDQLPNGNEAH